MKNQYFNYESNDELFIQLLLGRRLNLEEYAKLNITPEQLELLHMFTYLYGGYKWYNYIQEKKEKRM